MPAPNDDGYPVVHRRPGRLPGLRGPHGHRLRPGRGHAGLDGAPADPGRHAPDLAGRRRHQLRDARARPADPRLRRRQAAGHDPGPPRGRGGAADHPRRHRPRALDRGPRRHRRLRDHRPRRRDGRRDDRDVGDHHAGAGRGRALGRDLDVPHRQAAQAHLRGRQAQRARRRPGRSPRPRPTGWSSSSRRTAAARPTPASRSSAGAGAADDRDGRRPARPDHRHGDRRRDDGRQPRGGRLRGRQRTPRSPRPRRRGAPTSTTPTTWSRRSPGSSATTRCRPCCRARPPAAD